jgi:hypothetical protein
MSRPSRALLALLLLALGTVSAGCAGPASVVAPPTSAEILKKPASANYTDAHFKLKIHTTSGAFIFDLAGDGTIVRKPPAQTWHYQGSFGAIPVAFDLITVGGKDYSRSQTTAKWAVKDATAKNLSPDDWSKVGNSKLVGEDTINGAKAWHVQAMPSVGVPFDLWVREADGYPLRLTSSGSPAASPSPSATGGAVVSTGTVEFDFDKFNTGVTIKAPAAADLG